MKNTRLSLHAFLLTWFCSTAALCAADTPGGKWVTLFNGKDLTGWVPVHDVTFKVADGNLRLVKGMGWLRTEKEYGDFILELEWRALVAQYDSGLLFRCQQEGKPWPTDGWQINLHQRKMGGLVRGYRDMMPADADRVPVNKWCKFRLEVRGKKCILTVDGEEALKFDGIDRARGYIGIQAEDKAFEFRNLRVLELK